MSITIMHSTIPELETIVGKIQERATPGAILPEIETIRKYCTAVTHEGIITAVLQSTIGEKFRKKFQGRMMQYYKTLHMNKFLTATTSSDLQDLHQSKSNEFSSITFAPGDRIVCVESGILAKSALSMSKLSRFDKILCLNSNHESTLLSQTLIKKTTPIEVVTSPGEKFNYSGIDRIYLPNIVAKKQEILEQIQRTGKQGVRLLVQKPTGFTSLFYNDYTKNLPRTFTLEKRVISNRKFSTRELHQLCLR